MTWSRGSACSWSEAHRQQQPCWGHVCKLSSGLEIPCASCHGSKFRTSGQVAGYSNLFEASRARSHESAECRPGVGSSLGLCGQRLLLEGFWVALKPHPNPSRTTPNPPQPPQTPKTIQAPKPPPPPHPPPKKKKRQNNKPKL